MASGAWNAEGIIVFARATGDGLFRISAEALGQTVPVTTLGYDER